MTTFSEFVFGHVYFPKTMTLLDADHMALKFDIDIPKTQVYEGVGPFISQYLNPEVNKI